MRVGMWSWKDVTWTVFEAWKGRLIEKIELSFDLLLGSRSGIFCLYALRCKLAFYGEIKGHSERAMVDVYGRQSEK